MRIESTPDVTLLTELAAFLNPTGVPLFENTADIVTFPDEEEEETGFVVFMQPNKMTDMSDKPINFFDTIFILLFLDKVIHCAEKNHKSVSICRLLF
jgi:hypothetical protein